MPRIGICLLAIIGIVLPITVASADIIMPGVRERILAERINAAGQLCPRVLAYDDWQGEEAKKLSEQGLSVYRVRCSNGHVFGVGIYPIKKNFSFAARKAAEARRAAGIPEPPLPAPVVKRLR